MRYVGSKARFRKELLPIILADRDPDQYYGEPFAGGFNLICHVDGPRIGNDIDSDVVSCMKAISEVQEHLILKHFGCGVMGW